MCGIFFYKSAVGFSDEKLLNLKRSFNKTKHRGPDNSTTIIVNNNTFIGFHRLAINDLSESGNQPFIFEQEDGKKIYLICNGEIYNHADLEKEYDFNCKTESDCEVIYHLYMKFGIEKVCEKLDGVYAFVIYREDTDELFFGRDTIGVRPMYISVNNEEIGICSEGKGLYDIMNDIDQFRPSHYGVYDINKCFYEHYRYNAYKSHEIRNFDEENVNELVRKYFINAVKKRLMSDRPIGCLLSGGLDSSLVASILSSELKKVGKKLNTYSIGFEGSTDLKYAKIVADHIDSNHHEILMNEETAYKSLEKIVSCIESWDTTTIRASTGMYFISKYIKENSEDVVIYSGEGADELMQGYLYFHYAPNEMAGLCESERLMNNLHYFDVLRCDRTTAGHGLEVRVPFLDIEFMSLIRALPDNIVCPNKEHNIEKYLIRNAFDKTDYLPKDILWRVKEAFSDGVSGKKRSWHTYIKEMCDDIFTDEQFELLKVKFLHESPKTKEDLLYCFYYEKYYGDMNWIPYRWMPKWVESDDPSARELKIYSDLNKSKNTNEEK